MYNALGHCLIRRHRVAPKEPLHHLLELFDAMARDLPRIRKARSSVKRLEELRTTWVARGVNDWPVSRKELPVSSKAAKH